MPELKLWQWVVVILVAFLLLTGGCAGGCNVVSRWSPSEESTKTKKEKQAEAAAEAAANKAAEKAVERKLKEIKDRDDAVKKEIKDQLDALKAKEDAFKKEKKEFADEVRAPLETRLNKVEDENRKLKEDNRKLQERVDALEGKKLPGAPAKDPKPAAAIEPKKADPANDSFKQWQNAQRIPKLMMEIASMERKWGYLDYEVKINAPRLNFGNNGSLGAIPQEQYVYRGTYQYTADWGKFDRESKKDLSKSKEENEEYDKISKEWDKKRAKIKDGQNERIKVRHDKAQEIVAKYLELYSLTGNERWRFYASVWTARGELK